MDAPKHHRRHHNPSVMRKPNVKPSATGTVLRPDDHVLTTFFAYTALVSCRNDQQFSGRKRGSSAHPSSPSNVPHPDYTRPTLFGANGLIIPKKTVLTSLLYLLCHTRKACIVYNNAFVRFPSRASKSRRSLRNIFLLSGYRCPT